MTLSLSSGGCNRVSAFAGPWLEVGRVVSSTREVRLACHHLYNINSREMRTTTPTTMSPIDVPLNLLLSVQVVEDMGADPTASLLRVPRLKTLRSYSVYK